MRARGVSAAQEKGTEYEMESSGDERRVRVG